MRPVRVTVTDEAVSAVIPLDRYQNPFNVGIGCVVDSGTPTYKVQYTFDDVFADDFDASSANWFDHATLAAKTEDDDSNIAFAVTGVRLNQTGTGVTTMTIIQSGG